MYIIETKQWLLHLQTIFFTVSVTSYIKIVGHFSKPIIKGFGEMSIKKQLTEVSNNLIEYS